ncbi:WXG100-like domain-containing protein [Streptomyces sp. NPDC002403]
MLTPSPEAQTLLMVFSGEKWPSINEDLLREAADHYDKLIGNFRDLQTYLIAVEKYVKENFSGKSAEEFEKYAQYLSGGGEASILNACAVQAENLAKIARDTANQAEYSKWMILGQVIQLMAEMAFEAAVSWIPGLNAVAHANTVAAEITLRIVVQQVIKALVKSIMIHTAMSVVIGEAMDVAVQLIQKGMGNRTDWDLEATKGALGFGALQGVFGGVFSPIGGALGKQIGKTIGSDATKWLSTQIGKHLDTLGAKEGAKAGASKGLANSLGNILGGTESELVKNLDKSTGKLISDSFVDKVGDAFAKFGFHNLQGDAARNVGKAWASSLNKHWTTDGTIDVVSGSIAKDLAKSVGDQVDADALRTLSHTITQDVAKSLSSKAMAETLTRTQKFGFAAGLYGTSALVDAGAQNLAEGTYNSMTQGEFTTSWQTFVSGVAPTMFSHVMRHTVVHPLIAQSDSGLANFIKDLHSKFDTLDKPGGEFAPKAVVNNAAVDSVPNDSTVTPAPGAGDRATVSLDNGPGPNADLETEVEENAQQPAAPPAAPVIPAVKQTPVETATQAAKSAAVPPVVSPVVPPEVSTNPTVTPQKAAQVLNQPAPQPDAQNQTPPQVTPNPAPSAAGNNSGAYPTKHYPLHSTPLSSEFNEMLQQSPLNSRRTESHADPLIVQNSIEMQDLSTSAEPITSTVDSNDSGQANSNDGNDHTGNSNDGNDHTGNNNDQLQDSTQQNHATNDTTTAASTTAPPLEVIDSKGDKKTIHIPGFLNDVSTYAEESEQIPFKGAVGGHHAVQLNHDRDSAQLADELADAAKVTLKTPSELAFALANQANTFLGDGRRFIVTEGGRPRELRVKAIPDQNGWEFVPKHESAPGDAVKMDTVARNQQTEGHSLSESSTIQAPISAAVAGAGVAGRGTVTPGMTTSRDANLNTQQLSQRETRSHGPSVKLSTNVTYELSLHDIPTTESTGTQNTPDTPVTIKHTVAKGLVIQVPEAHTTSNSRPDPRKDRVPLKFTTESGERASIEHTESYFHLDPMTDWVLQHTDSAIGSENYKAVVNHFSAEHFTQIDGRDPVPALRLHKKDGSAAGTVTIGAPVPKRHWVIDSSTDFELRDTAQFSEKNESNVTRSHNLDVSGFVGGAVDPTGYSEAYAAPRAQVGLTVGYSHSSSNTSNLGGTAGAKHAERSPKDVRTVLVMRESDVTVETPDGARKTFTVGSLVRMPVGEAQRLAGWDNQEQLRVGSDNEPKKPAYWNTGDSGDSKVTMLGPGRTGEIKFGKETSPQETPNRNDRNESERNENDQNENTPSEHDQDQNPTVRNTSERDRREAEEELVDSLLDDLRKADPNLPLATREEVKKADEHRSWFNRLFRRGRVSVNAVANTRSLMVAVAKQGMGRRMHQAATKEGVRVQLIGSSFTRDRGYTLTIRADLNQPVYVGSARRTTTQAFSGGERFDTAQQITHTVSAGVEATFSARRNEKDAFGAPVATGTGGIGARGMYRSTRQVKSGGTANREDLFAPTPGTDYYDFNGDLTFELQRSSFPQPLIQAITLGGWRALARYGSDSHYKAVEWLYRKSGLGGVGETREDGSKSVFLTPHPIEFTFGVPDSLSKTGEMPQGDQDRIAGRTESMVLTETEVLEPDEISSRGFATVTLAARSDRTLFGSVRDLIGKTSGGTWRLTDAGAVMSERVRRIFGQHSFTSLSDQVFSPGGHTVGNLHDKGTLFAGDESLSINGTRHNLQVVGEPFTASPEMNTALEQAFGFSKGRSSGGAFGTTGSFGGLEAAGDVNFSGQSGVSNTWLQKFWNRGGNSSVTSMRDLNQVLGNDRWVMVVADTDYRVGAHHKPLGFFGRPFGSSRDGRTPVIRKPGGWVGLMRESDALKAGLIKDGLGDVPKGTIEDVEWQGRKGLDGASRGAFAHNAPQDATQLKKLGEDLRKAGIAEQTLHTINGMVSARSGRSAIQSGGTLTSRGRTSALTHVKKLNILGKDVSINVQHRRVGKPKVIDTLFGDHEWGAGRTTSQEKSYSSAVSNAHSVNGGETVRGPGGTGGITGTAGGGLGDSLSATDSVSGVVTQVTTVPGPKAVMETEWETIVTVTYSDGTDVIDPVKWNATVTTSESYLMLEPKVDSSASQTQPTSLLPKATMTVEVPKNGSDPGALLKETAKKNGPSARKGDGGLHIHEVIGAEQVQNLGKLLVSKSHSNDRKLKAQHEYRDDEIAKAVKKAVDDGGVVKPGSSGADALDMALNDISLTAALSSGHAQAGQHAVTVTNNSIVGGIDTTLVVATHLDFKSPKVRRIAVTGQMRFDDLTGSGTGTEMSDTISSNSAGGPGVAGTAVKSGVTTTPGVPVASVNTATGETHKLAQAEQSRLNLKPPAGHGHLYAVPATFHLAAGSQHHIKDSTVGRPFTTRSALQSGTTEATVLVWLSDERVKELGLHELNKDEIEAAAAVKQAEEAWEANYKEYWEQRRRAKALEDNPTEYEKARKRLEDLEKKIAEAGNEYVRLRGLTDPMFSVPNSTAEEPIKFREIVRHDHGKPEVEDDFKEVTDEDGNPTAITIDGTTHPLRDVENEGEGFFDALAEGFKQSGDEALPQVNGSDLRRVLAEELGAKAAGTAGNPGESYFADLAKLVPPDLADAFDEQDVRQAGLDKLVDEPTSKAGREYRDRGAVPPMKDALTEQQRITLASISAGRDGNREVLTDHGTADLYPALAAALWQVPVTVAHGGKLHTFMPDGGKAEVDDVKAGVLLHLKDRTYRYVDQNSTVSTQDETPPEAETPAVVEGKTPTQPVPEVTEPRIRTDVSEDEELGSPNDSNTISQGIFDVLSSSVSPDEQLADPNLDKQYADPTPGEELAAPDLDEELIHLADQLNLPGDGIAALDENLKNLGIRRADWYAFDGHLARDGSSLSALAESGDPTRIREAVVDWLAEPVHVPSAAVHQVVGRYGGMSPHHLERLLRTYGLHDAHGLVEAIEGSTPQGSVTQTAHVVEWFAAHSDEIARLRDRQDGDRLADTMNRLSITVPDTDAAHATATDGPQLSAFRSWQADNGGDEHLARTTDEQLREAVARWYLDTRQEIGNLPAEIDVHALLRLGQAAEAAGTSAQFHQDVTHHLTEGSLAEAVALAEALGHGAGLQEVGPLTRALGIDAGTLRPFGKLLGRRLAQHAAAPEAIRAAVDSFRVDLARHGFTTADLSTLTMGGDGHAMVDPIGTEELDSFARYLAHQQILGTTPHAAIRAWRELPTIEAFTYVETWRGNDTAEGKILGTIEILPPNDQDYKLLDYLGPNGLRAFRVQRVELPDGDIRSDVVIPIKLLHKPGQEHLADAAKKVAQTSLDRYLNAPRYRLSNGDLLHVSVEFTDADVTVDRWPGGSLKSPRNGIHLVDLSYEPGGRMEARDWKLPSDHLSVFAHELTHLLGPWDYYREHANVLRPVYTDRALMGGPVHGDRFGNVAVGSLQRVQGRLHNQRMMPRDLRLIGSVIEETWKSAGRKPAPHDGLRSELPLHVAERVLRGDPSTGKAGHLAPIGTGGRIRPEPLGDTNPNGTYRAAGGGPDNESIMMFPDHWSLEEVTEAAVHVHRDQLRYGNIGPDGEFEGVHHGVRIRGHARPDGTITHFEPSEWQGDLAPRPLADPTVEPRSKPFAEGGEPMSTHRLWDFLEIGNRSHGIGGHVRPAADTAQNPQNNITPPTRKAVSYDLFTNTRSRAGTRRAAAHSLELRQNAQNQNIRSILTSPGPAVAVSDGVSNLNTVFPDEWQSWQLDGTLGYAHWDALNNGNFTVLPSGGYIWHGVVAGVPVHGQVLDGEHQWIRPSWHQPQPVTRGSHEVLARTKGIEFHTDDGAHYRMLRTLYTNGEQATSIVRVLHLSAEDSMSMQAESMRSTRLGLGEIPGLGPAQLVFEVEPDVTGNGPDTDLLNRASSHGMADTRVLLGSGYDAMKLSAPRVLGPDQWMPPAGRPNDSAWRAHTAAVLEHHGPNALSHEPGVDALVQLHTAQELAPHADRERTQQDLIGATNHLFHTGAGNDLTIPESLRGDWTPDRVRLAALQHSSYGRPVEGRSTPDTLVLEAFPEPGVRLEIHHELGADGVWRIADYTIHSDEGTEVPPLWQPDEALATAAAGMGVDPGHLFVLSQVLVLRPQDLTSAAALLRGLGDPYAVIDELRLMSTRLGIDDVRLLTERMSAFGIGVEHWWDLAAHLQSSGHTVSDLIHAGPGSDLATAWEQRTQGPVRRDIVTQALALGVQPRRLEMVMNAALINDPGVFAGHDPKAWAALTPQQIAERYFGWSSRGDFDGMAAQLGRVSVPQSAWGDFAAWIGASGDRPPGGLKELTHAMALWRLGRRGPADSLPDDSDPRPLARLATSLGIMPGHAHIYIEGPGKETGRLPMTVHLEQRYAAGQKAAGAFYDPARNGTPNPLIVLAMADVLNIAPHLLTRIPQLSVPGRGTVSTLLWNGNPFSDAELVRQRLAELELAPGELAWFQDSVVTDKDITDFWSYVEEHRTSDSELAELWDGNREAGPAAVRKWVAHKEAATQGATSEPPMTQETESRSATANHSSSVNGPPGTEPPSEQGEALPDTLLALAKQLSSSSAVDRTGLADADLFQGTSPAARDTRMTAFRKAMLQAGTTVDVDERAARIASDIKSNQYFTDGNTRTATAAVFTTYSAAGAGLGATPLEVFAAIGEAEVNPHFDLTQWLRERHTDDGPVTVPSVAELEEISVVAGQLAAVAAGFQRIDGYWRDYLRRHPTESEETGQDDFLAELLEDSEADYDLWAEREEFKRAIDLIRPGGRTGFLNTVAQRRAPKDNGETLVQEIERLMEALGLDE